jgi:ATP-dependent helicase/nuclease subunit A
MSTKWTEEQKEAIFTKNCNLLVAAGAGAGKTAVLVERIIQRIIDDKENVDIDKLLVVTFTNAAAGEMRERVGDAISRQLEARPESKKLQRQLTLLNQSNIMTIHSFCLKVIKNNFHVIDLDPSFRVSDNTEAILLKQETIDELFEEKYEESNNELFLKLVDSYGGKNDFKVQSMVLSLYEFAKSTPWPNIWLEEMAERFNVDDDFNFGDSRWADILLRYLKIEGQACKSKMEKAVEIVENAEGIEYYLEPFKIDLQNIYSIANCTSWDKLKREFNKLSFEKIPVKRNKDADKEAKEKSKKIRDEVKKKLTEIKENIFTGTDSIGNNLKELYPMMKCLTELVMDFDQKYSTKKRERGIVDFSDIEHFCLSILTTEDEEGNIVNSPVALEYKQQFEEILIDEYQDSNEVQEVIMNSISRKNDIPNMFMVGDVKQSIYRFRQAKPELFLNKYNIYSEEKGTQERKIKLFKNFRSRVEIIDGVNYLFKQIMSKEIGELEYDEGEALKSGAEFPDIECDDEIVSEEYSKNLLEDNDKSEKEAYEYYIKNVCGGNIELHLIDKHSSDVFEDDDLDANEAIAEDSEEETPDNIQIEARLVAKRINELINSDGKEKFNIYDKNIKGYRPVSYKDIVILMRATSNWAPTFVEELTSVGIPVFADTATGYFETVEIRTIMSLLQIIDNPIQDIPLIAVLRSTIEAFEPEELMDIRMVNKEVSFYETMKAIIDNKVNVENEDVEPRRYILEHISEELKNKVSNFLSKLNKWRRKVLHMPIDEFIWYLYTETGYYGFTGAMPGGSQRQANLRLLFERAKQYEKTSYKGLFNFINFINKLKNSSGDMGSAKILGENEDVVRIMSIHKSKGLEFPVVILAGSGKQFNLMDMNRSILFHGELGLGPDYVDPDRRISYPTVVKQVLKRKIKIETLSEEMRILYVAFTRAKEKLIITGMVSNIVNTIAKWYEAAVYKGDKISQYSIGNAKSYLDWIGPAVVRHTCGKDLREVIEKESAPKFIIEDKSRWSVKTWSKESFIKKVNVDDNDDDIIKEIESVNLTSDKSKYNEEINRRLNWEYKYMKSSNIPAKFSVSELKRKFNLIDINESREMISSVVLKKPLFIQKNRTLSGAERGTLMHLVMQHLDLNKVSSHEEIEEQVKSLINREFITENEGKEVQIYKILKFFKTGLGQRLKNAKSIYREIPFFIEISSTELYKDLPKELYEDEKVLVQGIIDCYFEEDDKLVLLDYKTDFVEDINKIKEKYSLQICYYKRALEKMSGKSIKNTYLYSFFKDEIVEI